MMTAKQYIEAREKEPQEVYRIVNRATGEAQGVYSRAYHDNYDFRSVGQARDSNCHGTYKDTEKYRIAKYRVTYELLEDDCE